MLRVTPRTLGDTCFPSLLKIDNLYFPSSKIQPHKIETGEVRDTETQREKTKFFASAIPSSLIPDAQGCEI